MGLRETVKAGAATAFAAAGNIPISVTLRHRATGVYDPAIGYAPSTATDETVDIIPSRYRTFEVDGSAIKPGDQKAILLQAGLTTAPALHDELVISGETWQIMDAKQDGVSATWTLQLRRP